MLACYDGGGGACCLQHLPFRHFIVRGFEVSLLSRFLQIIPALVLMDKYLFSSSPGLREAGRGW